MPDRERRFAREYTNLGRMSGTSLAMSFRVEGFRLLLLAGSIGAMLITSLYVSAQNAANAAAPVALEWAPEPSLLAATPPETATTTPELPMGLNAEDVDLPDDAEMEEFDLSEMTIAEMTLEDLARANAQDIVLEGFRIGPLSVTANEHAGAVSEVARTATSDERSASASNGATEATESAPRATPRRARRRPRPPPPPRLHPNPGMHTILVARQMMARNEVIQGSCYHYLSEVYERAGHDGWRKRTIAYRAEREGPYADLDLIRPGDWLYIVTDPGSSPPGTHSVMFVGWQDRAQGYARTISHPGWGAPHAGRESSYDVSQTYRIIRPTLPN